MADRRGDTPRRGGTRRRGTAARPGPDPAASQAARAAALPPAQASTMQAALRPLLERVRGEVVAGETTPDDIPIQWLGEVLFHVRLPSPDAAPPPESTDLSDGLARLIADVESELGGSLQDLSRAQKQQAVRLLEERGAFEMRKSAETVAEALGLTRFTVYNYLNRTREI